MLTTQLAKDREKSQQSSAYGTPYGSVAQKRASDMIYEMFLYKSDKAIVQASRVKPRTIMTNHDIRRTMEIGYEATRFGQARNIRTIISSGNILLDKAIEDIIRSADLPPLPDKHPHNTLPRAIRIGIDKPAGRHPLILYVSHD